jgi:hypothetical protein
MCKNGFSDKGAPIRDTNEASSAWDVTQMRLAIYLVATPLLLSLQHFEALEVGVLLFLYSAARYTKG